ncbi:single-stranded DNA-binding protein [Sphaerisporangium viridialbum]|uniref:single-stranded DNA-binding protein n=1 Tax=Sphaerisporangium viridialbum TaxID=46189 RepID=UPI003C74A803
MSYGDTSITFVGHLVDDPELRFTPSGVAVARFRVGSSSRVFDKEAGQYKDGNKLFLTCNVWREAAEYAQETLTKGMRVIVVGRLVQRSFEGKDGQNVTLYEIEAEEVGASLRNATAQVTKRTRNTRAPQEWQTATPQPPAPALAAPAAPAPAAPAGGYWVPQPTHAPQPVGVGAGTPPF